MCWASTVGRATRCGLGGPGIESRCRRNFLHLSGPDTGAHPASCTIGTGLFPGVRRSGRGVNYPLPSGAEVKERVELYLLLPLWVFLVCSRANFTFLPFFTFTTRHYTPEDCVLHPQSIVCCPVT